MEELTSQTIPSWFVAMLLVSTGIMWWMNYKRELKTDFRGVAFTFILWGLVYGIGFQLFSIDIETRGFLSRLMICFIALSQFYALTISYYRSIKRGHQ